MRQATAKEGPLSYPVPLLISELRDAVGESGHDTPKASL